MTDARQFVFGRDERVSVRYLLVGTGVAVFVFGLKFVGYTLGGPEELFTSVWAVVLLSLVTLALGAAHARENEGVLVSVLLAFLPAVAEREFDVLLGVGQPNPGVLYGVWLALLFAVPVGVVAFLIGRRL